MLRGRKNREKKENASLEKMDAGKETEGTERREGRENKGVMMGIEG